MDSVGLQALQTWCNTSNEGVLVIDLSGTICLMNPCLQRLFRLKEVPQTVDQLLRQTEGSIPELRALLAMTDLRDRAQWGNLRVQVHPPQRLSWEQIPLIENERLEGLLTIFRDAPIQGQLEVAKQSFLSMISHDLRTPLSTILGFAELMYQNRGKLAEDEQKEFLEHIIKNANQLSHYTQIVLDIMFLEANTQNFEPEKVALDTYVKNWLKDARHRFPVNQLHLRNGTDNYPMAAVSSPALHKILHILVEFALEESSSNEAVTIWLDYDSAHAHIIIQHKAANLKPEDAAVLFRLMHPRDLSESGRPYLHRMQLYVASLLAERQQGYLTLRGRDNAYFQIDLALPLA